QLARWRTENWIQHPSPQPPPRSGEGEKDRSSPLSASGRGSETWVLASVRPSRCERLRDWLQAQGNTVVLLERAEQLPLTTRVVAPHRVGIDRLLDAVAAKRRLPAGRPAVLVDAGSAVTVDWLDETHTFCGGAIFPGLHLMAQSLNDY